MPSTPIVLDSKVKPAKKGNTRVTGKEQYYTPKELARDLMLDVSRLVPNLSALTMLEPAGGTGTFIEAARDLGVSKFISFDIEPHHPDVQKADFLSQNLSQRGLVTVTNPPFGRNNSLSVPFFNKAAEYSNFIGFLVPRSWRKWSVLNRLDLNFHLVFDRDVNVDYVDVDDELISERSTLNTCFQVWERRNHKRALIKVPDYGVVQKTSFEDADVSLTVFGYGCGTVKTEFPRRANTTQMFLKLGHPLALDALQNVEFSTFFQRTAYTPALSLQEINFLINEYISIRDSTFQGNLK
jgi:predicted RNA methylase